MHGVRFVILVTDLNWPYTGKDDDDANDDNVDINTVEY
jgi:hypothetical protein